MNDEARNIQPVDIAGLIVHTLSFIVRSRFTQ